MQIIVMSQAIVGLHDIARFVEREIGKGELSEDIRKAADRLNKLTQEQYDDGSK